MVEEKVPKQAGWQGVPREEIDWHPTVDENKCVGCGICVSCGRNVFDYDWERRKAIVARPLQCMGASPWGYRKGAKPPADKLPGKKGEVRGMP